MINSMSDIDLTVISSVKSRIQNVKEVLLKIPEQRKLKCPFKQIDKNPPKFIYKPRFVFANEAISQNVKIELLKIIDDIHLYLKQYSTDKFVILKDIIDTDPDNKNSIISLLENDVYKTDHVYGEYLVEIKEDYYEISYYRRDKKVLTLPNQPKTTNLEDFVKSDAINQIQTQFIKLWSVLENEIERCKNQYLSKLEIEKEGEVRVIKQLLAHKECEFLDFKSHMYKLNSENIKTKLEQKKEFLKDVLGLINNKRYDDNFGKAYLIVGVSEEGGEYNRIHRNIDTVNKQSIIQILNEFIFPSIDIEINEYYISGDKDNILFSNVNKERYDRIILLTLKYEIGIVYELKKKIGNPAENVKLYYEGTSFTRDGSHTRRMMQQDRYKIMNLHGDIHEGDDIIYDIRELSLENSFPDDKKHLMKADLIENYINLIETKDLTHNSLMKLLESIEREILVIIHFQTQNKKFIPTIIKFIEFSCRYLEKKEIIPSRKLFYLLRELSSVPEILREINRICLTSLIKRYQTGERDWHFINLLKNCGYFKDLFEEILKAIDSKDIELLTNLTGLEFKVHDFDHDKWKMITTLIERKETLNRDEGGNLSADDQRIVKYIDNIIKKIEKF